MAYRRLYGIPDDWGTAVNVQTMVYGNTGEESGTGVAFTYSRDLNALLLSTIEFVKGDKDSVAKLTDLPDAERPTLLVFDLNNLNAKPMTLIPKFKAKLKKATSIIGFLNHLQGELKAKAIDAGCDTVMPRSAFSQSLPNLLRRYGMEEEEEYAQQPV